MSKAKLNDTRLVAVFASYEFSISYKAGKDNSDVDGLSRTLFRDVFQVVCHFDITSQPLADCIHRYSCFSFCRCRNTKI